MNEKQTIITVRLVIDAADVPVDRVQALLHYGTIGDAFADGGMPLASATAYGADIVSIAEDMESLLEEVIVPDVTAAWVNDKRAVVKHFRAATDDKEPRS